MIPPVMCCYLVERDTAGNIVGRVTTASTADLPPGEATIAVHYSSANYKDALAAQGHPGVARRLPHIPGIDAAGVVVESSVASLPSGAEVLVTGDELGAGQWGGWAEFIRVPAEWVVPLPTGLTLREAMILGTAGFTAAQCVQAFQRQGIEPHSGPVVVTGATGGVGSLAVMLLAKLGYRVTAVTGKTGRHDWLRSLGAAEVVGREAVRDESDRPLLSSRWAGAVDTVGGATLSTLIRSMQHRGCVAACGLVGGHELHLTVYPFLLRGCRLEGIDSAHCPGPQRREIWRLLANEWRLAGLERVASEVPLSDVGRVVADLLAGRSVGRPVIRIGASTR